MTAQNPKNTRFTFELPSIEHKKLKALAALNGLSLKDLILECIRENLLSENVPNEETIKTFKETDSRKNLVRYKNVDDLIDKLELR
ncbi:Uncharacterized protein PHSC3_000460 [Chlamydiales bacterium STE3]|nr:Uncharacterized protein PHSC3_000460 [Chlamydiales bacterium STE3]